MAKFFIAKLDERNGEYKYAHPMRFKLRATWSDTELALDRIAKDFHDNGEKAGDGYDFNGGEIHVSAGRFKEISEATFNDLDGIIPDMTRL